MNNKKILEGIEIELRRIKKRQKNFPDHLCAQAGSVTNEAANLMQAALINKYSEQFVNTQELIIYALRTAAMAIRFVENISKAEKNKIEN